MSGGWINVKERLPDSNAPVLLVCRDEGEIDAPLHVCCLGSWDAQRERFCGLEDGLVVTHWTALPPPPDLLAEARGIKG